MFIFIWVGIYVFFIKKIVFSPKIFTFLVKIQFNIKGIDSLSTRRDLSIYTHIIQYNIILFFYFFGVIDSNLAENLSCKKLI